MKHLSLASLTAFTALAFAMGTTPGFASEDLAKSKGCTACHQVEKKVIGPAYAQVSACYASKDAKKLAANKAALVKHVKEGGAGVWGQIPMPAHPQVANEDVAKIVDWVMTLKPSECPSEFKPKS